MTASYLKEGKHVERRNISCNILVGADGAGSTVRRLVGVEMKGENDLQKLVSIHFFSRELGEYLLKDRPGMLYFIFNTEAIGVLVAHDLKQGEFILQVPFYPPQQNIEDFCPAMCNELIFKLVGQNLCDIDVQDVKPWIMHAEVAEKFICCRNHVLLAGDAAHRFPPAGGFVVNEVFRRKREGNSDEFGNWRRSSSRNTVNDSTIDGDETMTKEVKNEGQTNKADGDEPLSDSDKFKNVDMPVFCGLDLDSWLFRADRYFQIHKISDLEKLTVTVIGFDGAALDWYRFLEIKQETTVEDYRNLFDKLVAPSPELPNEVLEVTFMNGLSPWIKAKVECWEPNDEIGSTCGESGSNKRGSWIENEFRSENKLGGTVPMRTITLCGNSAIENQQDGLVHRLTDVEFQARRDKGLCFRCDEKYYAGHRCKVREKRELRTLVVQENGELEGSINDEAVIALIDYGAVHNFISDKLTSSLKLPKEEASNYGVILVRRGRCDSRDAMAPFIRDHGSGLEEAYNDILEGVESRALEGGMTFAKFYGVDDILIVTESFPKFLGRFEDVFDRPEELPPKRGIEHHIHLKKGTNPLNKDVEKTTFRTHEGHYEFLVMKWANDEGMNTGIQDVHNLAWKLAAVLQDIASPSILNTYEMERRPIALFNTALSVKNFKAAMEVPAALGLDPKIANSVHRVVNNGLGSILSSSLQSAVLDGIFKIGRLQLSDIFLNVKNPIGSSRLAKLRHIFDEGKSLQLQFPAEDLGFRYSDGAIIPDNTLLGGREEPTGRRRQYIPSADPGSRLPHMNVRVLASEDIISTLDLVSGDKIEFLLIIAPRSESYHLAHAGFKVAEEFKTSVKVCILWSASTTKIESSSKDLLTPWENYVDVEEIRQSTTSPSWWDICKMTDKGAILVRPDEHIAWRVKSGISGDPNTELMRVFTTLLK
ncbi:putative polyketide hydroxylase [Cucumis melo var. makuwa]|uniref:Polyketide hydroxylase n=1 Tax=Cucumis melo var. makuwa TaxID=1194695 RepID=A0A5A7UMT6_CUCMM|nr:putative polyketide hydroxylase [Cucumis melo var. makuwa]